MMKAGWIGVPFLFSINWVMYQYCNNHNFKTYVWNETILFVIDRKLNEGLFKSIFWISLFSHVNSVPERGSWETIAITLHFSVRFYFFVLLWGGGGGGGGGETYFKHKRSASDNCCVSCLSSWSEAAMQYFSMTALCFNEWMKMLTFGFPFCNFDLKMWNFAIKIIMSLLISALTSDQKDWTAGHSQSRWSNVSSSWLQKSHVGVPVKCLKYK